MASILILGATSDMAYATANEFASNGYNIILAARNFEALIPMKSDLHIRHEVSVDLVFFDALDFESHPQLINKYSGDLECVACFFGYLGDQQKAESNWEESNKIIASNYTAAVSILNIASNYFVQQGRGSIIGVSSVAGDRGRMSNYIYGSAKAGFTAYLSGLRNRLFHHNIQVLTVKPGFVNTKMTANLNLPPLLTASPKQVAKDIYKAWNNKRNIIYTLWFWRYIMAIITLIPEFLFKKLKL